MLSRIKWIVTAALACGGCAPPASQGGFDGPDPASKLYAIERAAVTKDQASIGHLIDCLRSSDPAVRSMAGMSLVRITGEDCGYRDSDPPDKRNAAIDEWTALARKRGWIAADQHGG
jgi:hypothetical protein